jgi:uncharacterized SAM-binding protein YcdF (DUF218 family)
LVIFHKKGRVVILLLTLVTYLLSTQFIGNLLLKPLESKYDHPFILEKNVDAVVILSGGHYGKRENLPLSQSALKRAIFGIMLAKKSSLPIVFSGAGLNIYTESDAMKDTVNQLNNYLDFNLTISNTLLPNHFSILYEAKSLDTFENAMFTKNLFVGNKNPRIYLVTSAFHMKRSEKLYKYFGFDVIPSATDFLTIKKYMFRSFMPSMSGLNMSYYALHEYAGMILLQYKLK